MTTQKRLSTNVLSVPERRWSAPVWRKLHAQAVALTNRLCRQNNWRLDWFGVPAQLHVADVQWIGDAATSLRHELLARVHWRGIDGYLGLNHLAAEAALAHHLGAVLWQDLPPSVARALLQDGADCLGAAPANQALGPLRFQALVSSGDLPRTLCNVQLRITPDEGGEVIALDWLVDPAAVESGRLFSSHRWPDGNGTQDDRLSIWGGLPIKVAFELGWVHLPLNELQGLRSEDVLLPDGWWGGQENDRVGLRVGSNTSWGMGYTGVLDETRQRIKLTGLQEMERDIPEKMLSVFDLNTDHPSHPDADGRAPDQLPSPADVTAAGSLHLGALGDMPVRLTFDLGESSITLQELSTIGVGHVFDLALSPRSGVNLRVNGLRVGEGEIVDIDGRLGVAVTRILPPRI